MNPMMIIVAVVVFWTCLVLGILIGMSLHRTAQRRQIHRQGLAQRAINARREDLHDSWMELQDQRDEFEGARRRAVDW
jgi:uncharacterized membrane-anchored protein YhcB (DUF1043 family)